MKPISQLASSFEAKINAVIREVEAAERKTATEAKSIFVKRSSGTMTAAQRKMLGYPYSRRRPNGDVDPTYINVGTGDLRRSWVVMYPKIIAGLMTTSVVNTSKDSLYMFGTSKMVPRRLDILVAALIRLIRIANLRRAIQKGLRA